MPTSEHVTLRVEGVPSPASRPRVTRWGAYYTPAYEAWKSACQTQVAEQLAGSSRAGALWCAVTVIVAKPRTSKLTRPVGDADNYVKPVLDGMTKAGAWRDDSDVELLVACKRFARPGEEPGAEVHFGVIQ